MTPRLTARKLMTTYHTHDPLELATALDYIVLDVPLVEVRGFYQYAQRNHIIYLSDSLCDEDRRFVCAHELGHALLHRGVNTVFLDSRTFQITSRYEMEANHFAAEFLHPDEEVREYLEYTTAQIANCLNLTLALVEYRLSTYQKPY